MFTSEARRFWDRLAKAPPPPVRAARLCLLTGQSRFDRSPLSLAQSTFLRAAAPSGMTPLLIGFPFDDTLGMASSPPWLVAASARNALQVGWTRLDRFNALVARVLQGVFDATEQRLVLFTGSCGLEMLTAAWPRLTRSATLGVEVLSFGPTGPGLAGAGLRFAAVQGAHDVWSRALYRGKIDHGIGCGHLGYWTDPRARALAMAFTRGVESPP